MVSGFVASVQGKEISGKIVVVKVRNSQRMNKVILFWIIAESVLRNHPVGKYSGSC